MDFEMEYKLAKETVGKGSTSPGDRPRTPYTLYLLYVGGSSLVNDVFHG